MGACLALVTLVWVAARPSDVIYKTFFSNSLMSCVFPFAMFVCWSTVVVVFLSNLPSLHTTIDLSHIPVLCLHACCTVTSDKSRLFWIACPILTDLCRYAPPNMNLCRNPILCLLSVGVRQSRSLVNFILYNRPSFPFHMSPGLNCGITLLRHQSLEVPSQSAPGLLQLANVFYRTNVTMAATESKVDQRERDHSPVNEDVPVH